MESTVYYATSKTHKGHHVYFSKFDFVTVWYNKDMEFWQMECFFDDVSQDPFKK